MQLITPRPFSTSEECVAKKKSCTWIVASHTGHWFSYCTIFKVQDRELEVRWKYKCGLGSLQLHTPASGVSVSMASRAPQVHTVKRLVDQLGGWHMTLEPNLGSRPRAELFALVMGRSQDGAGWAPDVNQHSASLLRSRTFDFRDPHVKVNI